jgi:hypothetical protein
MLASLLLTALFLFAEPPDALTRLVQLTTRIGSKGPLDGRVSTGLGLTLKNQPLEVQQLALGNAESSRSFNIGGSKLILSRKTPTGTTLYVMTPNGVLQRAIQVKPGQPMWDMPLPHANAGFETERSWWLETWLTGYEAAHKEDAKPSPKPN